MRKRAVERRAVSVGRNRNCGGCVYRDGHLPIETVLFLCPGAPYFAIHRIQFGGGVSQSAPGTRVHEDMFVAGVIGIDIDAANGRIHPRANRAISVVVEGIHLRILKAFIVRPTVPAFPDRCRSPCDRIQPGGPGRLFEQGIGDIQKEGNLRLLIE